MNMKDMLYWKFINKGSLLDEESEEERIWITKALEETKGMQLNCKKY